MEMNPGRGFLIIYLGQVPMTGSGRPSDTRVARSGINALMVVDVLGILSWKLSPAEFD